VNEAVGTGVAMVSVTRSTHSSAYETHFSFCSDYQPKAIEKTIEHNNFLKSLFLNHNIETYISNRVSYSIKSTNYRDESMHDEITDNLQPVPELSR